MSGSPPLRSAVQVTVSPTMGEAGSQLMASMTGACSVAMATGPVGPSDWSSDGGSAGTCGGATCVGAICRGELRSQRVWVVAREKKRACGAGRSLHSSSAARCCKMNSMRSPPRPRAAMRTVGLRSPPPTMTAEL